MMKKLIILSLAALLSVPAMAQKSKELLKYKPNKGQTQISLILGNGQGISNDNLSFLVPSQGSDIGLPGGSGNASGDLNYYLNLGSVNNNSMVNMAGIQFKYFLCNCLDINAMFSMSLNLTPTQNYLEGNYEIDKMPIEGVRYVNGQVSNQFFATLGSNWHFNTKSERLSIYAGILGGFQMARINTTRPYYTGQYDEEGNPLEVYTMPGRIGQVTGITGAVTTGIEYWIAKEVSLGIEVRPFSYNRAVYVMQLEGNSNKFAATNNRYDFFSFPTLKLGFKF